MKPQTNQEIPKALESVPGLDLWFDTPPNSGVRAKSVPPPSALEKVGEFLGDPDVDAWLR